jgi:hypothetical protein
MQSKDLHSPLPAQHKPQFSPSSIQPQPKECHTRQRIIVIPLRRFKPHRRIQSVRLRHSGRNRIQVHRLQSQPLRPGNSFLRQPSPKSESAKRSIHPKPFISQPDSSPATHRKATQPAATPSTSASSSTKYGPGSPSNSCLYPSRQIFAAPAGLAARYSP